MRECVQGHCSHSPAGKLLPTQRNISGLLQPNKCLIVVHRPLLLWPASEALAEQDMWLHGLLLWNSSAPDVAASSESGTAPAFIKWHSDPLRVLSMTHMAFAGAHVAVQAMSAVVLSGAQSRIVHDATSMCNRCVAWRGLFALSAESPSPVPAGPRERASAHMYHRTLPQFC